LAGRIRGTNWPSGNISNYCFFLLVPQKQHNRRAGAAAAETITGKMGEMACPEVNVFRSYVAASRKNEGPLVVMPANMQGFDVILDTQRLD